MTVILELLLCLQVSLLLMMDKKGLAAPVAQAVLKMKTDRRIKRPAYIYKGVCT